MTKKVYRILIPTLTFFYLWLALGGLDQAAKLWLKLVIIAIGAFLSLLWIRMVRLPPFREVRHLWHQIETLQFMIVSDPKNRLDLLKRRVFADQARHFRGLAVYSYVLSMLSGLILDGLGFVRVSDFVVTIGWTLALMVLITVYIIGAIQAFATHLIRTFVSLQLFAPLALLIGLNITGIMPDFSAFRDYILYYLLLSITISAVMIVMVPNYQLRVLTNYIPAINATSTVVIFLLAEFGNTAMAGIAHQISHGLDLSPTLTASLFGPKMIAAIRELLTLVSIVFLISGNVISAVMTHYRVKSENQLKQVLADITLPISSTDYQRLRSIVYHGLAYNALLIIGRQDLYQAVRTYERQHGLEPPAEEAAQSKRRWFEWFNRH